MRRRADADIAGKGLVLAGIGRLSSSARDMGGASPSPDSRHSTALR
ncbi:hypothetical protein [Paracoccus sanguinis]|nr:hypothetical protein [Paracoccus sanguinis]